MTTKRAEESEAEEINDETDMEDNAQAQIEQPTQDDKALLNSTETKLTLARKMINNLKNDLSNLARLLESDAESADLEQFVKHTPTLEGDLLHPVNEGKMIEGVFDGQNMIGSDGKLYMVPPNYASKSKLVEGDIMKLTIQPNGSFLYKQIGPIERSRVMGVLTRDEITNDWKVIADGKKYSILTASVTYFKGSNGDDVVILLPKAAPSKWAAVENIVRRD
jgi:hypothetical protein